MGEPSVVTKCRSCGAIKETRDSAIGRVVIPHDTFEDGMFLPCPGSDMPPRIASVNTIRARGVL